ncbi:hypothetical protein F5Y18DRAFT_376462 [Xylariaceae sp. FL1019]|nr:hypothetical protein F5Y18DRAFT_376462 [Xylariaceae sp. FL1019]
MSQQADSSVQLVEDCYTASNRSQLSESLSWFRISQGGLYSKDCCILGILLGECPAPGDMLTDRVIVTRVSDLPLGNSPQVFKQRNKMASKAQQERSQIGIVVSAKHPSVKIKPPRGEAFALLGFWVLTDTWTIWETCDTTRPGQPNIRRVLMGRLDKVDTSQGIWWTSERTSAGEIVSSAACPHCGTHIPARYEGISCCTHGECPKAIDPSEENTFKTAPAYSKEWMAMRPDLSELPVASVDYLPKDDTETRPSTKDQVIASSLHRPGWTGFLCKTCNAFNQHIFWSKHVCRRCGNQPNPLLPLVRLSFQDVVDESFIALSDGSHVPGWKTFKTGNPPTAAITTCDVRTTQNFMIQKFEFTEESFVAVLYPKQHVLSNPGQNPSVWYQKCIDYFDSGSVELQRHAFSRYPDQRSAFFGTNFGDHYEFSQDVQDTPFEDADEVILSLKRYVEDAIREATGTSMSSNECLALAYYKNGSMGWHSDNEKGIIGDTIAAVSLGASCTMEFCLKDDVYTGKKGSKIVDTEAPLLRGAAKKVEKDLLDDRLRDKEITKGEHDALVRELLADVKAPRESYKILQMEIPGTGAIIIQSGVDINRLFKHRISMDKGLQRLSFTFRTVETKGEVGAEGPPRKKRKTE